MKKIIFIALLFALSSGAQASTAYGDLNNFDVVNDTGQLGHGFEIELDDIHSTDITYTFDWNHYGTPKIREDNSDPAHPKVFIRHESLKDASGNYTAYTAVPSAPLTPTNGHQCTNIAVNEGCEHFGVGYRVTPSAVKYNWLIDDGAGNLIYGPAVNIATPVWTYYPPVPAVQPAQVQAAIVAPPPPPVVVQQFGDAVWVKSIKTTSHNNGRVELKDLVSDDPNVANDRNWKNGEPEEVEVEWRILQTEFANPNGANNELAGAAEALPAGDEEVTRRYEFYKYIGDFQDTHEVWCDLWLDNWTAEKIATLKPECLDPADPTKPLPLVGEYIGAQMAGFNVAAPLGMIDNLQDGNLSEPYTDRSIVVGGNTPYVTTVSAGMLPDGMSIDPSTGVLSGTPTVCGVFPITVDATDADAVHVSKPYTLNIVSPDGCPLKVANGNVKGEVGVPVTSQALVSGGSPAYVIDTSGGDPLPAGLNINTATGVLSGTPVSAGVANVVLAVTDAASTQSFGTVAIDIVPAVGVAPIVLPSGTRGTPYTATTLTAINGIAPYRWAISAGSLPAGLSLDANTGTISGTPTVAGSFSVTFQVTDSLNAVAATPSLTVTIAQPVSISTLSLPSATVGQVYSASLTASGGKAPYSWSLSAGSLPAGLTLSSGGVISGTATVAGTFNPTFRVRDSNGAVSSKTLGLTVAAAGGVLSIGTNSLPSGTVNKFYSVILSARGGTSPYTWTVTGLPAGLTASGGKISGIPTVSGTFNVTLKVTDSKNATASKTLSLVIAKVTTGTVVDIKGIIGAIDRINKFITVDTTRVYYNANTTMLLNTDAGKILTTGTLPAGVVVGMPVQGKGTKSTTGKITATSLEFN